MIEASMIVNDRMPEYCVERAAKILNRFEKALKGSRVLVLGVAYKQNIDDFRESPALAVIEELEKSGTEVVYFDPYIPEFKEHGKFRKGETELTEKLIKSADLVMITTSHTNIDYDFVGQHAKMIFDTKNATKLVKNKENIELL